MRSRRFTTVSLALLLFSPLSIVSTATAQDTLPAISSQPKEDPKTDALRKQIQGYYNEMDAAANRKDMVNAFKYMAPDCKVILRDGMKVNLKFLKDTTTMLYNRAVKSEGRTEITQFSMKGNTATVETHSVSHLRIRSDNGIENDMDSVGDTREFWMKTKAGWRIKQTRETDRNLKINGQVISE